VVSEQLPDGGIELSAAEIDALDARWSSSWTPSEVPGHLAGIATPWYVAGGWAWICRQDASIRFPYDEIIQRTHDGIPYLTPELVLLFKAKHARQKDQADFDATLPRLTAAQRRTLGEFLTRVHPGHRWSAAVSAPPSERC
jgi:hypothetical protein